ncbi:MAG: Mycofactocin system transcriptional regulator [uncultured Blastococcus sp.]|uniref:Mycofactocin system transcriptional regulator n=1 Tax=uncultured Blastococcus sp. TaxID=217144 RepID=A0A6J4JAY9_9ACTN|nr:MAG: Mycofactocin system transcriptional regulator [uncultured Blastococcus sp.]
MTQTGTAPAGDARARVERAALELFALRGFDAVTTEEVADAAGISRRTFFRHHPTKADAVWGDFARHVARLAELLRNTDPARPILAAVCRAYVDVNDYGPDDLPVLRQRMRLILTEPALQAHSQLRYAEIDRVVAEYVARRTGEAPTDLLPRLVGASTRAAAMTAFAVWLTDDGLSLREQLTRAFDELTEGFPSLRR